MMVTITCPNCGSAINVEAGKENQVAVCDVCQHKVTCHFDESHHQGIVKSCVVCERKDFYQQKDFNRKIGVILFVIAAILSIWTYGISLVVLYLVDVFLFRKLKPIAICYKCQTIYRNAKNILEIPDFDHEMNDRIVYSDQNFEGRGLKH